MNFALKLSLGGLVSCLSLSALADTPRANAPKENEIVIRSSNFGIESADGRKYDCRKAEFGSFKKLDDQLVYHLGVIDYTCDVAQRTFQIMCRVSWGPELPTPPGDIDAANGVGDVKVFTADPAKPDSLRMRSDAEKFVGIAHDRIDEVARDFLKDKCLAQVP